MGHRADAVAALAAPARNDRVMQPPGAVSVPSQPPAASSLWPVRVFLVALAALLAGYMFMGRGLAHLGVPPIYVGELVLFVGLVATAAAAVRLPIVRRPPLVMWLLLTFMALGIARTLPYLTTYGVDALRDAVLWGYGAFAVMVFLLSDRAVVQQALRAYSWIVPVFALWLPICFNIFLVLSADIQPDERGSNIPLIFFKSGDMAVHVVGALALLVVGSPTLRTLRTLAWRAAITVPLLWTAFVGGATNRGGLVTVAGGLVVIAILAYLLGRFRNLLPIVVGPALLVLLFGAAAVVSQLSSSLPPPSSPMPAASAAGTPDVQGTGADEPAATADCEAVPVRRSLVGNSGFETGNVAHGAIEGWRLEGGGFELVRTGGFRGAAYLSVESGGAGAGTLTSVRCSFPPGHEISVSVRAKATDGRPVVSTVVNWYDASESRIASQPVASLDTEGDPAWRESAGTTAAPIGATYAEVELQVQGQGTAGLDEVIVTSATSTCPARPEARNLVANGEFELGDLNDGTIEGWRTGDPDTGAYHIVEGAAHRGATHASVESSGSEQPANIRSCRFPFEATDDISVSLWAKAIAGAPALDIFVIWYTSSGDQIATTLVGSLATGGVTAWQEAGGGLKAPAATAHGEVELRESAGGATIGIDDITVTAVASGSDVSNAGFELGSPASGRISAWELSAGTGVVMQDGAYAGDNFVALHGGAAGYTAAISSSQFAVEDGDDVSVAFYAKAVAGSPTAVVFVNWYDARGDLVSSLPITTLDTGGVSEWQESTGIVTAPLGVSAANVVIWEAAGGTSTVGIDEVIVLSGDLIDEPPAPEGRPATIDQIIENIASIFAPTSDEGLEGTKRFRLRWWTAIVNYTVFGEHFWTGKGFGINLADADGFQANEDQSLRAPHNSHMTALARMGVPGFLLWLLLQGAFGVGLVRAVWRSRRSRDFALAAVGAWVLAYWVAMMVNTSFDPYLEGPQGGIWFWSLFGLGIAVIELTTRRSDA